jgi:hypothetical protein
MKNVSVGAKILAMLSVSVNGCGQAANPFKGYKQPPDTDVSSLPEYNFSSFAGTVWKTKVKVGLADLKRYTGRHDTALLPPEHFDPAHPKYNPAVDMQLYCCASHRHPPPN